MTDLSQANIIKKILSYLKISFLNEQKKKKLGIFDSQDSSELNTLLKKIQHGYCSGLSSTWLYSRWLQTQDNPQKKIRDDYEVLSSTLKLIADWNEKIEDLNPEEKKNIDYFINHIIFFQNIFDYLPIDQSNLIGSLEDTKGRKLNKDYYSFYSLLSLEQLKKVLKTKIEDKEFIQNEELIMITTFPTTRGYEEGHDQALFRDGDNYYYLDPSNTDREIQTMSLDEVAEAMFKNHYTRSIYKLSNLFCQPPITREEAEKEYINEASEYNRKPFSIGFKMFTFDKELKKHPEQRIIFEKIKPELDKRVGNVYSSFTDLMIAASKGFTESVRYFLDKGVDANTQNDLGNTALIYAVNSGYSETVKALLDRNYAKPADPDIQDSNGNTVLMKAARRGQLEVVKSLLAAGAKTDIINKDKNGNYVALMFAAKSGHLEVVKEILKYDDNIDRKNIYGKTALMYAAMFGHVDIVECLIHKGSDFKMLDSSSLSAFMLAVKKDHFQVVKFLLEKGADYDVKNNDGLNAIDIIMKSAITNNRKSILEALEKEKLKKEKEAMEIKKKERLTFVEKILKEDNAKINTPDEYGFTSLIYAAKYGRLDIVKNILEKEADLEIRCKGGNDVSKFGGTALFVALENKNFEIVEFLLDNGADYSVENDDGNDLLYMLLELEFDDKVNIKLLEGIQKKLKGENLRNKNI